MCRSRYFKLNRFVVGIVAMCCTFSVAMSSVTDGGDACAGGSVGQPIEESTFCKSLIPGKYILPAKDGWWNWGMAPIYDEMGTLHIFNSSLAGCIYSSSRPINIAKVAALPSY